MDGYHIEKQKETEVNDLERQLRDGYLEKFVSADLDWWKKEIDVLNDKLKHEKDSMTRQMYSRIKGFLGIVCYSYTSQAMSKKDMKLAERNIGIYSIVEPENSDCFYYKALWYDYQEKPDSAVSLLNRSIKFGLMDTAKIRLQFSKKTYNLFHQKVK